MNRNKNRIPKKDSIKIFFFLCITGVSLSILLETIIAAMNRNHMKKKETGRLKYYILSNIHNGEERNGYLKHLHWMLERVGYKCVTNNTEWDLMWTQNSFLYPLQNSHLKLKPHQRLNQFPGSEFITNKVQLATSKSKYLPIAFKLPNKIDNFKKYTKYNPQSMFLEKKRNGRGSTLKDLKDIDLYSGNIYVQEFVQNPFLVDGYKFDIGVYVVLTSINPLRAYWYKSDVLFRFCPTKFYPFHRNNTSSYMITTKYLGIWELPSLSYYYATLGHGMKDTFDSYLRSQGKDPSRVWEAVQKAIVEILVMKERLLVPAVKRYPSQDNFFEMMRFDFILDEFLKVYLLKVKKSPELGSDNYAEDPLLYKQLLYSLFSLTGISRNLVLSKNKTRENSEARDMISSRKHIAVFGKECKSSICKESCEAQEVCQLCRLCLSRSLKEHLLKAHTEYLHKGDFRRLFPPPMYKMEDTNLIAHLTPNKTLSAVNRLQHIWYQGKCNQDVTWCT